MINTTLRYVSYLALSWAYVVITKRETEAEGSRTCLGGYGLSNPENLYNEKDYSFCWEHSGRTCCSHEDVQGTREKIALVKARSTGNGNGNDLSD